MGTPAIIEGSTLQATVGQLSVRQTEAALWAAEGKTDPEIAILIGRTARTVKHHITQSMGKLDCHTRAQLVAKLFVEGVLSSKTMALLLSCSLLTGIITTGGTDQPFRIRGGARITTRINRPLQVHTGA